LTGEKDRQVLQKGDGTIRTVSRKRGKTRKGLVGEEKNPLKKRRHSNEEKDAKHAREEQPAVTGNDQAKENVRAQKISLKRNQHTGEKG